MVVVPSRVENTFFISVRLLFLATAAIEGPLPETEAPNAPFSTNLEIIFGSEFRRADVANPFISLHSNSQIFLQDSTLVQKYHFVF